MKACISALICLFSTLLVLSEAFSSDRFVSLNGVVWEHHHFTDQEGEAGSFFVTGSPDAANLVLLIQGSGCVPLFESFDGRDYVASASQDALAEALGDRARLMIVEKPHVAFNSAITTAPGTSEGCDEAFRQRYSLDDWVGVLDAAIQSYLASTTSDIRVAAVGFSEGVLAATALARIGRADLVGVISAGTCFHEARMIERAVTRHNQGVGGADLPQTLDIFSNIARHPAAIDRFAWSHTYLRWSTFGRACDTDFLMQWEGPVFIAYGTLDADLDITGLEALRIGREMNGLPTRAIRLIGGDHGLFVDDVDHRPEVFSQFASFLEAAR